MFKRIHADEALQLIDTRDVILVDVRDPGSYRAAHLPGAINVLAFDGHVERLEERDGRTAGGLGAGARRASWWFPSGTKTAKLPSRRGSEPALTVP